MVNTIIVYTLYVHHHEYCSSKREKVLDSSEKQCYWATQPKATTKTFVEHHKAPGPCWPTTSVGIPWRLPGFANFAAYEVPTPACSGIFRSVN